MGGRGRQLWTFGFLLFAWLTTLTGFLFPFNGATPAFILGVISLLPLTLATVSRYKFRLEGRWLKVYVVNIVISVYINVFVLVVQAFQKIPALHALAPTQTEQPFKITQTAVILAFIAMGIQAFRKFRPTTSLLKG